MGYHVGDYVIVRDENTIREENGYCTNEYFYTREGVRFGKEKAAYCGRLLRVSCINNTYGNHPRYKLTDPLTSLEVQYNDGGTMFFSSDMLYLASVADETTVQPGSTVWVRPWQEIAAQADSPTSLDDRDCMVKSIWITESMKKMCCKKYQILHISHDIDDVVVATLCGENNVTWNFPLNTLYCSTVYVQPVITQPTVSFEELFGKETL